MRIKATQDQLHGIVTLLAVMIETVTPNNIADEIIDELVNNIYIKLYKKSLQLYTNSHSWSFTLTTLEAKAFYLFYQNTYADSVNYHYEALQLQRMFNEIDQVYGRINRKNTTNRALASGTPPRRLGS